jgi:RNA polymerase sigma factor (sigma-70 family)
VVSDRYRKLSTDLLLRRVAAARAAGDWTAARGEWEACITRARERVENVVRGRYGGEDREAVVQEALLRGSTKLIENLDRLDENAFFAAMVRVAYFQAHDSWRSEAAYRVHVAGSLDQPAANNPDDDAPGRFAKQEAREAHERAWRDEEATDAARRIQEAIEKLPDPRARKILTYDRLGGRTDAQIAEELGISVANVQTIRSRSLKRLRGLIEP